ncbi:MAG TPA: PD-(D/E)XK nuclease-like domain-containing protein [Staphylococcus ureilyticus]|uniref:PD-(D/E)XK nuclease-like domain-containing protein n=1 Tax=Staphylococcus ureilyticus TaxID=94138 RepID=UPI001DCCF991|nr:PD-(D/E)XK nuclease-like domain-containing protein [Staphylococcus ureilyticus]HJG66986.1 PD-(D/E)XK nuclease-like domain-containing protein [Staphylococcus ureilyticus]
MNIKEQLDTKYYETKMLSVSSVKLFAQNPARALDDWNGVYKWFSNKQELNFGNYVHSGIQDALEDTDKYLKEFMNETPDMFTKAGTLLAKFRLADTVLNKFLSSATFKELLEARNIYKMFVEKPFMSEYQGIRYKGKIDLMFIDDKNKNIHCIDFKTSRPYAQNGIEWGTMLDGSQKKTSVAWHVEKLFPVQAGVYRQLLQDNGYSDYKIDYTYIVMTKETSPRIDIWNITDKAMNKGLDIFFENLVLANKYITGQAVAPIIFDDSAWAHEKSLERPNVLLADLEEDDEEVLDYQEKKLFTGIV